MKSNTVERDWTTEAGLRAVAILIHGMHRCGYVEIPKGHPLYGVDYNEETDALDFDPDDILVGKKTAMLAVTATVGGTDGEIRRSPDIAFDVHGGLTYADSGENGYPVESNGWWFGFDCGHYGDGSLNPTIAEFDEGPVRSEEYVVAECERLSEQIVAAFPEESPMEEPA